MFFMRAEWSLDGFDLNEETFQEQFGAIAREFHLRWSQGSVGSTATHRHLRLPLPALPACPAALRDRRLTGEIAMIVSNHQDAWATSLLLQESRSTTSRRRA